MYTHAACLYTCIFRHVACTAHARFHIYACSHISRFQNMIMYGVANIAIFTYVYIRVCTCIYVQKSIYLHNCEFVCLREMYMLYVYRYIHAHPLHGQMPGPQLPFQMPRRTTPDEDTAVASVVTNIMVPYSEGYQVPQICLKVLY